MFLARKPDAVAGRLQAAPERVLPPHAKRFRRRSAVFSPKTWHEARPVQKLEALRSPRTGFRRPAIMFSRAKGRTWAPGPRPREGHLDRFDALCESFRAGRRDDLAQRKRSGRQSGAKEASLGRPTPCASNRLVRPPPRLNGFRPEWKTIVPIRRRDPKRSGSGSARHSTISFLRYAQRGIMFLDGACPRSEAILRMSSKRWAPRGAPPVRADRTDPIVCPPVCCCRPG